MHNTSPACLPLPPHLPTHSYSYSGCGAGVPGFRLVLARVPRYTYFR